MGEGFAWDVEQAPRGTQAYGSARPSATLHLEGESGTEFLRIPACVAREVARRKKSGEFCPQSRSELLSHIEGLCERVAMERVSALIARRDYPKADVVARLRRDGFGDALARSTAQRAEEVGLVSDARFADAFIRGKLGAGWGLERIARELSRKGIDVDSMAGWPHEYADPYDEWQRAVEAASRKTVREPNAYAKMVRFLMGRGFSYGVAKGAAQEVLS